MPAAKRPDSNAPRQRILRIGIILGGKIIEERLVRKRETITIGQSAKNTFSVPIEGLPRSWPLFVVQEDRYFLQYNDTMDGRVSDGGDVRTFDALKNGVAQRRGEFWAVPLSEHARGKLSLGEMTLLFQFVTAPPLQPRPRLPASVRGTLADRVDPHLAVILAASVLLHFGVAVYAYTRDQVVQSRIEKLHQQFQEEQYQQRTVTSTFQMPKAPAEEKAEETQEAKGEEKQEEKKPKSSGSSRPKRTESAEPEGGGGSPDDAAIREAIANTAFLKIATGGAGAGGRYSEMNNIDQGAELNAAIENIKNSGATVSSAGGAGSRRTRGPGSGEIGTGKGPGVGGPAAGGSIEGKAEETIASRASLDPVDALDETTLDPSEVAKRIQTRYILGIKRCHQNALKRDPKASGRVELEFTVGPSGQVTKAEVKGFDPEVDSCIKGLTRTWRFGVPKDDSGAATTASFVIPLVLKPN
jgi:outer membrane biosynthesis protein TonB